MKNNIIFILFIFVFLSFNTVTASEHKEIYADDNYYWDDDHEWDTIDNGDFYRFYNLDGHLFAFRAKSDGDLLLYKYSHHDREFNYEAKLEDPYTAGYYPAFDPVAFTFLSELYAFYYYGYYYQYQDGTSDYEHYGKMFHSTYGGYKDWKSGKRKESKKEDIKIYRAACSNDSEIYLIYDSYIKDNVNHHHKKDIYIDVATIEGKNRLLKVHKTIKLYNVMEKNDFHPYAATNFIHPDGKERIMISYSAEHTGDEENKGGGVLIYSPEDHTYHKLYHDNDNIFSIRAINGTLKGKHDRASGKEKYRDNPNRIQVFYNHFKDKAGWWNDNGSFHYRTYVIEDDKYVLVAYGSIPQHTKDMHPDDWEDMKMDLAYRLHPVDYSHAVAGDDSYHQSIWLFHTDKFRTIRANIFSSDKWLAIPGSTVSSTDLTNDDETTGYGTDVRSLWTMVGLVEGAPPCAIDWDLWEERHPGSATLEPTELTITHSEEHECTISSSFENTFSLAVETRITKVISAGFKYTNKYKHTNAFTTEQELELELSFPLNQEAQEYAYKIWLVPNITRVSYATFPWWDTNHTQKIANSETYMFMSSGDNYITEKVELSEPFFGIESPNDSTLEDWKPTNISRQTIVENAANYNIHPINFNWQDPIAGQVAKLTNTTIDVETTERSNSFEVSVGASGKGIPLVFKASVEISDEFKFTSEIETSTKLSQGVEFSLVNLKEKGDGPKIGGVNISAYFFPLKDEKGKAYDWWYFDHFEDQKPWYIAYVVNSTDPLDSESQLLDMQADDSNIPIEFSLADNFPNPFNPITNISFSIPVATDLKITIYNINGEKVATIYDNFTAQGIHSVTWNGYDSNNVPVPSGMYFYKLDAGEHFHQVKKLTLLR